MTLSIVIHVFETYNIFLCIISAYSFLGELSTLLIDSSDASQAQVRVIFVKGRLL